MCGGMSGPLVLINITALSLSHTTNTQSPASSFVFWSPSRPRLTINHCRHDVQSHGKDEQESELDLEFEQKTRALTDVEHAAHF